MKTRIVSPNSPGCQRVLAVLRAADEPIDGHMIAELACVAFNTFQNTIRHALMSAEPPLIHIAEWRHNTRGPFMPAYRIGPLVGRAPRKPQKIDQLERARNWKQRSGYNDLRKAQRRIARMQSAPSALAAQLGVAR